MIDVAALMRTRAKWKRVMHSLALDTFAEEEATVTSGGSFDVGLWEAAIGHVWRGAANEWIPQVETMLDPSKGLVDDEGLGPELGRIVSRQASAILDVTEEAWLEIGAGAWDDATGRAVVVSQTESVGSVSWSQHRTAQKTPQLRKIWQSILDERTRATHLSANGQTRLLNDPFSVGGASLQWPADTGGPLGEIINCRCWEDYALI